MSDFSRESAERVSALMDGHLEGDEFDQCLLELLNEPQVRTRWDTYHLIGRSLRTGPVDTQVCDSAFVARLSQRLKQEAVLIEPLPAATISVDRTYQSPTAANRGNWRRVVGLASVMLVAVLAWQGLGPVAQSPDGAQVARSTIPLGNSDNLRSTAVSVDTKVQTLIRSDGTSVLTASTDAPVMIRDPQLDALLAAHRNFAGASALQMAPGFVRNANFEEVGR
jgi:sigma-E factor negative regulatory protein RseA